MSIDTATRVAAAQVAAAGKNALLAEARKITREEDWSGHLTEQIIDLAIQRLEEERVVTASERTRRLRGV